MIQLVKQQGKLDFCCEVKPLLLSDWRSREGGVPAEADI